MTTYFPHIRHRGFPPVSSRLDDGEQPRPRKELLAREVIRFAFYLPHDHPDISQGVSHAIDSYMRAVGEGPATINYVHFSHDEGTRVSEDAWGRVRRLLQASQRWSFPEDYNPTKRREVEKRGFEKGLLFTGGFGSENGYTLEYRARIPWRTPPPNAVSLLIATLPTEYLEAHGASRVRELALDMASQLRFASGHAGLALHLYWPLRSSDTALRADLARHPGIDLRTAWLHAERMGVHVDGVHWLNFLAQPVLGQLGGVAALRSRLHAPETTVRELDEERVVISLGEWPEAGDLTAGRTLPSYRELARVLEPWLEPLHMSSTTWQRTPEEPLLYTSMRFTEDEARRWWRRFLD